MKFRLLVCLVLTALFLPVTSAAKDTWTKVNSKNFHLVGNASDKEIRRVATKLEQFREVFRQIFPKANFTSVIPTTVVVFKDVKSYKPFLPVRGDGKADTNVAGYFQSGEDVNYITLSTEGESAQTYDTIFHEYVHFLVNNNLGRSNIPPWFNEGLAEYYSTFEVEDEQKAILGNFHPEHLYLLKEQKLIPFEQFFAIDHFSLRNQGNHGKNMFYAQAWALIHYLQQGDKGAGGRRGQLNKFLGLVMANKPPREAFQEAFQTDYATMERELKNYVERRSFTMNVFVFKEKLSFETQMQSTPISEAEANAYLGDLLFHTHRFDEAAARLQQALAADDKLPMAHASLGMTRMRQRKFSEAKQHLEKAAALDAKNHLVHYYHAYVLSREGMDENNLVMNYAPEATGKMRESLKKAMELKPDFPESYRLLGFINLVNNENLDEGIAALRKALSLQPGNQTYLLNIAQIYMRKESFEEARKIANNLIATADEPELRSAAQELVRRINLMEEQVAQIKAMNSRQSGEGSAPPVLRESGNRQGSTVINVPPDMTPEEAINLAIHEALRKPQAGEQRVLGYLTQIDCDSKGQAFVVRTDSQTMKFRLAPMQNLMLMAFVPNLDGQQIGCGARKPENLVVATFRLSSDAKAKTNGEIVSLEFVPKNFKLKE